jgi:hypothetical protein
MSSSAAENIAFLVVRGIVALAIIGVAFYCIGQGIHYFMLPRLEAEAIQVHVLGLNISATGLGAVIFGTGIALCFFGLRATPRRFESKKTIENFPPRPGTPPAVELQNRGAVPSTDAMSSSEKAPKFPKQTIEESVLTFVPSRIFEQTTASLISPVSKESNVRDDLE